MPVRSSLTALALLALTAACATTAPPPEPARDEPTAPSAAEERRRLRMRALAPPLVVEEEPGPPLRREPFTALYADGIVHVDPTIEFAPDQVFRATQFGRSGLRVKLEPRRKTLWESVEGSSETIRREDWPVPGQFRLVPFPQDMDRSARFVDGETIDFTPLGQIQGCEDVPRPGGVSDVMPPPARGAR